MIIFRPIVKDPAKAEENVDEEMKTEEKEEEKPEEEIKQENGNENEPEEKMIVDGGVIVWVVISLSSGPLSSFQLV